MTISHQGTQVTPVMRTSHHLLPQGHPGRNERPEAKLHCAPQVAPQRRDHCSVLELQVCPWAVWGVLLSSKSIHPCCYANRKTWGMIITSFKLDFPAAGDWVPFLLSPPAYTTLALPPAAGCSGVDLLGKALSCLLPPPPACPWRPKHLCVLVNLTE